MTIPMHAAAPSARISGAVPQRLAYAAAGVAAAVLAWALDGWSWPLLAFAVLPDLPLAFGFTPGLEKGRLHPRAVPAYNATHRLVGPVLLVALGAWTYVGGGAATWLVAGLAWAAHVLIDRGCGYGLRGRDGWQR